MLSSDWKWTGTQREASDEEYGLSVRWQMCLLRHLKSVDKDMMIANMRTDSKDGGIYDEELRLAVESKVHLS